MEGTHALPLWIILDKMEQKILKAINQYKMLENVTEITVALSGGADSVALLYALNSLKNELGFKLYAAHFNHKIRGKEAEYDQQFVTLKCKELGIELFIGSADVLDFANKNNMSIELAAREKRYEFLKSVARGVVATAHTADDNIETILFNMARGTALKGLCGIPEARDIFIRPLIFCSRADVESYCESKKIEYVTDSTNLSDDYTRNKIRHKVIPVLREINPSLCDTVNRTVLSLKEDNDFIETVSKQEFLKRFSNDYLILECFDNLHKALALRVIKSFLETMILKSVDNFHIGKLYEVALKGGKTSLPDAMCGYRKENKLYIEKEGVTGEKVKYNVKLSKIDNTFFKKSEKVNGLFLNNALDCDKIVGELILRTRQTGDKIKLNRRNGTKTLKKLYTEHAVPQNTRETLPVLADGEGVVWVCSLGVAERCAVTKETQNMIKIEVEII